MLKSSKRPQRPQFKSALLGQGQGLHSRTIPIRNISPADEYAWRNLAERAIEPNPFYEADFLVPASRNLRNGKRAMLLVAEEAGRFHACLPVPSVGLGIIPCFPVVTSWQHLYGYLGIPLVAPERSVEALECILASLRGRYPWPRVIAFELFGDDGPVASNLRDAAAGLGLTVHSATSGERPVFRCFGEQAGRPPANVRRQWRVKAKQWRRLCDDLGEPEVVDHAGDPGTPEIFLSLEAAGWKGKAGTALASRRGDATFYKEVAGRFAASGRLGLYTLEAAGRTLAMRTSIRTGNALFQWKTAYDERFANYGPGTQLELRIFDLVCNEGVQWIDSCSDADNKNCPRFYPDRRPIATLIISRNGEKNGLPLTLAVLHLNLDAKLRGLSPRTFRYRITQKYVSIRKAFHRRWAGLFRRVCRSAGLRRLRWSLRRSRSAVGNPCA